MTGRVYGEELEVKLFGIPDTDLPHISALIRMSTGLGAGRGHQRCQIAERRARAWRIVDVDPSCRGCGWCLVNWALKEPVFAFAKEGIDRVEDGNSYQYV